MSILSSDRMVETQFTLLKRGIRNNKRTTAMLSFSCVSYLEARDFSRVRLHVILAKYCDIQYNFHNWITDS